MNQYLKYALTVAVTAAAMVAYQYQGTPDQAGLAQQAPSQVPSQIPSQVTGIKNDIVQVEQPITQKTTTDQTELNSVDLADIDPASIDWKAMNRRLGTHAMINPTWGLGQLEVGVFSEKEIAAYNKLHVISFNPMIEEACYEESLPQESLAIGGVSTVCEPVMAHADHAYSSFQITDLKELAYSDAQAAAFAARKAEDDNEAAYFSIRAAAISGKSGPLVWIAKDRFDNTELDEWVDSDDEVFRRKTNYVRRLALESLAAEMGDPRANPKVYFNDLEATFGIVDAEKVKKTNIEALAGYKREINKIRQQLGLSLLFEGGDGNA
ncbi:hypothetical protein N8862_03055 [Pseudomonadales bacterium]|nr:hypothetical protein [Pseudomonadales bacterium]